MDLFKLLKEQKQQTKSWTRHGEEREGVQSPWELTCSDVACQVVMNDHGSFLPPWPSRCGQGIESAVSGGKTALFLSSHFLDYKEDLSNDKIFLELSYSFSFLDPYNYIVPPPTMYPFQSLLCPENLNPQNRNLPINSQNKKISSWTGVGVGNSAGLLKEALIIFSRNVYDQENVEWL